MRHLAARTELSLPGTILPTAIQPSNCYDICNEAFAEAQRVGVIPELCTANGPFQSQYETCIACIQEHGLDVRMRLIEYFGVEVFETVFEFCDATRTQSFISSTMMVTTITALGPDSMTTVAIMTVVVDLLATPAESSGLALAPTNSQTTPTVGPATDPATGKNGMYKPRPVLGTSAGAATNLSPPESSGAPQAWIAGPVIGGVVVLVSLVGAYIFFVRRRKRSRSERQENSGETWTGKPELHAESVPGLAKSLVEADGLARPPQELEGEPFEPYSHEIWVQNYGTGDQHANRWRAEMAANEVAAGEMDVRAQAQEVDWQSQTKSDANR